MSDYDASRNSNGHILLKAANSFPHPHGSCGISQPAMGGVMKDITMTCLGAAVYFDGLADDGWPEDAGLWPTDGFTSLRAKRHTNRVGDARSAPLSGLIKFLFRKRHRIEIS